MKRVALLGLVVTFLLAQSALAQDSGATQPAQPAPAAKPAPAATPNTTGAPKTKQSKTVEKRKAYTGNTGKKTDPGTACSSARPTANGGVDCGTGGDSATAGKVPK
ncbi:MAG: hypothetical protein QOI59_2065 [Gammaproteobacteria bacterium]|jgi:hypothetical protein|nr:hypothetical protein [Gammaproteobacteria bacterium]